ncbi:MAG: hypothetical protein AB2989_06985 [Candidatus Symbiodolus clandestinus]
MYDSDLSPFAFSVRAPKVRASFMRATNPTTMPRNFKLFCSRDNCWIDRDPWEIQRKKRATKLGFRRSIDQNSPTQGRDNDSSIENIMTMIKQSNETVNITFANISRLLTAMSMFNDQSTADSSLPTLSVASVAVMPAMLLLN